CPNDDEEILPTDCGHTPMYPAPQIVGGNIIPADEYSWVASLQYNKTVFGACSGSVINSQYVLTAAHCVTGQKVNWLGGLTGVRLGDFKRTIGNNEYDDYGTPNSQFHQDFGIREVKAHEHYGKDTNQVFVNDIALIRVNGRILFDGKMKPVCMPFGYAEETNDRLLIVGWGSTMTTEQIAKRAVEVPLRNATKCEYADETRICAGILDRQLSENHTTCVGDSGGPLMKQFERSRMAIEGIVSSNNGVCFNAFYPTQFTRVRSYKNWIKRN
ncbi:hypothetical protein KR222_011614, partial [Zaprionus bogoriensis]